MATQMAYVQLKQRECSCGSSYFLVADSSEQALCSRADASEIACAVCQAADDLCVSRPLLADMMIIHR